jgi:hypothetical protein
MDFHIYNVDTPLYLHAIQTYKSVLLIRVN